MCRWGLFGEFRFNSRTPKGCDTLVINIKSKSPVSIHAPLKGATSSLFSSLSACSSFNSRTPKGCD